VLIEREAELAALDDALARAVSGSGSFVLVSGGLGVGRSALLHEVGKAAAARGMRALRAVASPMEQEFGYGVVRQLLEPELAPGGALSGVPLPREATLESLLEDSGSPARAPVSHQALRQLESLVGRLAAEQPLVLLVDDLQWADTPSLSWLVYLAHRLRAVRLVVVATTIPGGEEEHVLADLPAPVTTVLNPRPFSLEGTRAFLARHRDEAPGDEFAAACHRSTGGNPMLLEGLVLEDAAQRGSPGGPRALSLAAPSDRVSRWLNLQPGQVGEVARAAIVLGEAAGPKLVAGLTGLHPVDVEGAVRVLRCLGSLPGDGLRFPEAIGNAIIGAMTVAERDGLHLRAAGLLYAGGVPAEQVAGQLLSTTAEPEPWATEALRAAAMSAMDRGDPAAAARYLRHALLHGDAARGRLLADLAIAERGYDLAASTRHLRQAVPLLDSPEKRAVALCLAPVLAGARYLPAAGVLERALAELADPFGSEPRLRLEARLRLAGEGDREELAAARNRLRGLDPASSLQSSARRELLVVLLHAAMVTDAEPRATVAELTHQVLEREPGGPAHMFSALPLAVPVLIASDSLDGLESWLAAAETGSEGFAAAMAGTCQAGFLAATGRLVAAKERALAVLRQAEPDWSWAVSNCATVLAGIAIELGDAELAQIALRDCAVWYHPWTEAMVHGAVALTSGDSSAAIEHFTDYGRQLGRAGRHNPTLFPWRPMVAPLYRRTGNRSLAVKLVDEEYAYAERWGAPASLGRALRLRASLAEGERVLELLHESVDVLGDSSNRLELAKSLVMLGKRARDQGQPEADQWLREGYELREALGLPGVPKGSTRPEDAPQARVADVDSLTDAERRIVDLVLEGRRNRDIADERGVTTRAVEKHLTSSYRKLGIGGRAELAAAMAGATEPEAADPPLA
jgi:DNA-binding CsgD family transcriptional regulator